MPLKALKNMCLIFMVSMFVALLAKCNAKTTNLQALLKQHHIPGMLIVY